MTNSNRPTPTTASLGSRLRSGDSSAASELGRKGGMASRGSRKDASESENS